MKPELPGYTESTVRYEKGHLLIDFAVTLDPEDNERLALLVRRAFQVLSREERAIHGMAESNVHYALAALEAEQGGQHVRFVELPS